MTGVRLVDEEGEPVLRPPTELEELDGPERRYLVWVDRQMGEEEAAHAFAFLSWGPAAEAERQFRGQLPAEPK
ncbi:MAG TPA: hypothetical protein VF129_09770 [Actinomycetota bacterium]